MLQLVQACALEAWRGAISARARTLSHHVGQLTGILASGSIALGAILMTGGLWQSESARIAAHSVVLP